MIIYILTKGRPLKQMTYDSLNNKYQNICRFVVVEEEYDLFVAKYGENKVIKRPEECNNSISLTRQWIYDNNKDKKYIMADDDIMIFNKVIKNEKGKFEKIRINEINSNEFDNVFNLIDITLDKYSFGSIIRSDTNPAGFYPYREHARCCNLLFFNGLTLKDIELDWSRCKHSEDLDITLQLLTKGYNNIVLGTYQIVIPSVQTQGGCSLDRTLKSHNESQNKLKELWPDFVSTRDKVVKSGEWKHLEKVSVRIGWKKAYLSSSNTHL
jgi:hypothetical protein